MYTQAQHCWQGAYLGHGIAIDWQAKLQAAKSTAARQRLAEAQHRHCSRHYNLRRLDVVHIDAKLGPPCAYTAQPVPAFTVEQLSPFYGVHFSL